MIHTIAPPTLEELNKRISTLEVMKAKWTGYPSYARALYIELYCLYAVRDGVAVSGQFDVHCAPPPDAKASHNHGEDKS